MVRALREREVMDAAMGTCDCQTLAAGEGKRGSSRCQHGSSLGGGKGRGPEGAGTRGVQPALPGTQERGTSRFALVQTDRETAVLLCLLLASGGTPGGKPCL